MCSCRLTARCVPLGAAAHARGAWTPVVPDRRPCRRRRDRERTPSNVGVYLRPQCAPLFPRICPLARSACASGAEIGTCAGPRIWPRDGCVGVSCMCVVCCWSTLTERHTRRAPDVFDADKLAKIKSEDCDKETVRAANIRWLKRGMGEFIDRLPDGAQPSLTFRCSLQLAFDCCSSGRTVPRRCMAMCNQCDSSSVSLVDVVRGVIVID